MNLLINGIPHTQINAVHLLGLLEQLNIDPNITAVEKNGIIIPKTDYATERLNDNDTLELIRFMGGGIGIKPNFI